MSADIDDIEQELERVIREVAPGFRQAVDDLVFLLLDGQRVEPVRVQFELDASGQSLSSGTVWFAELPGQVCTTSDWTRQNG